MPVYIFRVEVFFPGIQGPGLSRAHYIFGGSGGIPGEEHLAGELEAAASAVEVPAQWKFQRSSANAVQPTLSSALERPTLSSAATLFKRTGAANTVQRSNAVQAHKERPTLSSTTVQWKRALELATHEAAGCCLKPSQRSHLSPSKETRDPSSP